MGTSTSTISRLKVVHPDLGYDGGADLHTYVRNIYNQFGDNINSRVFFIDDFPIGGTITLVHNLGSRMTHNRFMLYSGSYAAMTPLSAATTPSLDNFTIADTTGFEDNKIDITNNSGALRDLIVVLYQDSISPNPLLAKVQTTPPAAPTGYFQIYPKADGKIYRKGSDGIETVVGGGLTPQLISFGESPVTVKDGTNYLVGSTAAEVIFNVASGSSALLQFGIKNDGVDFTVYRSRVTCATAPIYIPNLGVVGVGEYFDIDAPVEAILFDWDGSRWVASMSGLKDLTNLVNNRSIINTDITAVVRDNLHVDTSVTAKTITLPLAPIAGDYLTIGDAKNTFNINVCTLARNGNNIKGAASNFDCDISGKIYTAVYIDASYGWEIYF